MDAEKYCLTAIDGDAADFGADSTTAWLRFRSLTWDEIAQIARYCFREGYQCIIWKIDDETEVEDETGGDGECGKT